MATKVKIELNHDGIRELLMSQPIANECEKAASCATLPVWKGLYRVINEYLDSVSLQDLLSQGGGNDYCI